MNKILKLLTAVILVVSIGSLNACKKSFDNPPGATDPDLVANTSILQLKAMHTTPGAFDLITTDIIITGVVVANDKSGNLYKQMFIEDSTGGLQILLDANSLYGTYPVGRRIYVRCKDLSISDYNGTMQLGVKALVAGSPSFEAIPGNLISKYIVGGSINNPVVPHVVTLSQLSTNMQNRYLGTLIQLDDYAFTVLTGTYSDTSVYKSTVNRDIKNCSGSTVIVRTSAYANFAGLPVPQGRGSIAAIYTTFGTTKQLLLRDTSDVMFNAPYSCSLPPGTIFSEDFETIGAANAPVALPNWKNIGEVGGISYLNAIFGPVKAAKISAFSTGASTVTSWLITPQVNLAGAPAPKLTFMHAEGYATGATTFKVLVSTDYTGSNTPSTSTWTELWNLQATTPTTGYSSFVSSGNIDLSAYIGQNVYIAFKYDGSDPTKTTTYEIDDIKVVQ
ncbi:MAG: DUF5689 domain-containing protein [Ferruginibacter sp.]